MSRVGSAYPVVSPRRRISPLVATPFVMINNGKLQIDALSKKADFSDLTGLSVDIMKKIVDTDKISYTLTVYAGAATDVLNLLKTGEADIAIGNYAVLPELTTSFDFLSNYLYFTYSVLEEPSRALPVGASLFDFFGPLTDGFWVLIFFSAVIVALAMATLNYFSPNNLDFGFMESIFVAFGCLFQGLSVPPPNQWSSRILLSVWWMFSLFFVIIYATNYGALKTQSGMSSVVSGFDVSPASPVQFNSILFRGRHATALELPIVNTVAKKHIDTAEQFKKRSFT
ncbi:unnamed protein product [Dibothriocephalus latus]|uniref:Ionotropic glutamate receptor C-terminal domain-containing protein n=1 Tax=Dibothriocephalus latus TaxID=60516 RepID=A0A3P7NW57_DIBLA|nr:unnamed protein product [Dibothriocephalus latus]